MILHQGNKSIEFTIVNYQYPEKRPSKEGFDYDANWLMCEVKYSDAETNETYKDAYLLTDELADMVEELSEIIDGSEFHGTIFEGCGGKSGRENCDYFSVRL